MHPCLAVAATCHPPNLPASILPGTARHVVQVPGYTLTVRPSRCHRLRLPCRARRSAGRRRCRLRWCTLRWMIMTLSCCTPGATCVMLVCLPCPTDSLLLVGSRQRFARLARLCDRHTAARGHPAAGSCLCTCLSGLPPAKRAAHSSPPGPALPCHPCLRTETDFRDGSEPWWSS